MPPNCKWLSEAIEMMEAHPRLAAIGFRRFRLTGMKFSKSLSGSHVLPPLAAAEGDEEEVVNDHSTLQSHAEKEERSKDNNKDAHFRDRKTGHRFQFVSRCDASFLQIGEANS